MKIANLMFSRGLGGLEQASLDYAEALQGLGHDVVTFMDKKSPMRARFRAAGLKTVPLFHLGNYDIVAAGRLKWLLKAMEPDVTIIHGSRASTLSRFSPGLKVGVAHTYNLKRLLSLDHIICITQTIQKQLQEKGAFSGRLSHVPNMIQDTLPKASSAFHNPPVVGVMARLMPQKGLPVFLEALAQLKDRPLKAVIAGEGQEEAALKKMAKDLQVDVTFLPWTTPAEFHDKIDILCVPSLVEPFGIVILEAWAHGTPLIAADAEGPLEIIRDGENGLLVPKGDAAALAAVLRDLLENPKKALIMRENGLRAVFQTYQMSVVGKRLEDVLGSLVLAAKTRMP